MNFTSNKKKRLLYLKNSIESLSRKKRKPNSPNSIEIKKEDIDRFNFFIDILGVNKQIKTKSQKIKEKTSKIVSKENKENNSENIHKTASSKNLQTDNNNNKLIFLKNIYNVIMEDIENNNENNNKNKSINSFSKNNNENLDKDTVSREKPKYVHKKKLLQIKENKIIERNINFILNKEKSLTGKKKINKKDIDIVNQFQLNTLGYINFYSKRHKELIKSNRQNNTITRLNEEELEKLIDQEWMILEEKIKNRYIQDSVQKQTKIVKKNLKNKKSRQKNLPRNSFKNVNNNQNGNVDNKSENDNSNDNEKYNDNYNENEYENEIKNKNQESNNIPYILDSEMIKQELKDYTEINLLTEMYNNAKQMPIPHFSVIKHPPNPFSIFTKDNINMIIKKNPTMTRVQALKIVAKKWKNADSEEKTKYIEKSKEYREDYENLIRYAYLQRALINNPNIARLCLENQLKEKVNDKFDQEDENINFKDLNTDDEIVKAFKYIVRKFPQGYPLASPVLRFPERGITQKFKKSKNRSIENLNENETLLISKKTKKKLKININIKPKSQAFDFFVKDRYKLLLKATPTLSFSDLFDELEKEWKNLSYSDKLPYILLEIKDIKRYYIDQCEISKERRGRKRNIITGIFNEDNEIINEEEEENSMIIDNIPMGNNNKNKNKNIQIIKKASKGKQQQDQQDQQYYNNNEYSTFIEDSECEQDYDSSLLCIEKNRILGRNENDEIMEEHNHIQNDKINWSSFNDMDKNYINSDTSEEYLTFDNIDRKCIFENSNDNEIENLTKENIYDRFDIQTQINNTNVNINNNKNSNYSTFIPVTDTININDSINYSLSHQDEVEYNIPEKKLNNNSNITFSGNQYNESKGDESDENRSNTQMSTSFQDSKRENFVSLNTLLKKSFGNSLSESPNNKENNSNNDNNEPLSNTETLKDKIFKKKNNSNIFMESERTILETSSSNIENSMKSITSSLSIKPSILNENNLETLKNSQKSEILLKPHRSIRKSGTWKFGNDIGLVQQISKEKLNYIFSRNKNDYDDYDDFVDFDNDDDTDIGLDEISSFSSSNDDDNE